MTMNQSFYTAPSSIANGEKGLFASRFIAKGEILIVDFHRKEGSNTGVFEYDYTQSKTTAHINHSYTPNTVCNYNRKSDVFVRSALRDIRQGEEITANYREILDQAKAIGQVFQQDWMFFERK